MKTLFTADLYLGISGERPEKFHTQSEVFCELKNISSQKFYKRLESEIALSKPNRKSKKILINFNFREKKSILDFKRKIQLWKTKVFLIFEISSLKNENVNNFKSFFFAHFVKYFINQFFSDFFQTMTIY